MNLCSPSQVRGLLAERALAPSKAMGQNFLIDAHIRDLVLDMSGVEDGETVLEIGPGLGVLTERLLERGCRVVAIEKDRRLHAWLCEHLASFRAEGRLEAVHADALDCDLAGIVAGGARRVLSNLPYSVGNRILVNLVLGLSLPDTITIMTQQDVATRLLASPGSREYGVLTLFCRLFYDIRLVKRVSSGCFVPRPRVSSALLHATRNTRKALEQDDLATFRSLVKHCFSQRRKQIGTLLSRYPEKGDHNPRRRLDELGIPPQTRPEAISLEHWLGLAGIQENPLSERARQAGSF